MTAISRWLIIGGAMFIVLGKKLMDMNKSAGAGIMCFGIIIFGYGVSGAY